MQQESGHQNEQDEVEEDSFEVSSDVELSLVLEEVELSLEVELSTLEVSFYEHVVPEVTHEVPQHLV